MSSAAVLTVGAATWDVILGVEALPKGPGKLVATRLAEAGAGIATSAAIAIARLGGRAGVMARVGDDDTGRRYLEDLGRRGVDVSLVEVVPRARTAVSAVIVDESGERIACSYFDPRLRDTPPAVGPRTLEGYDAVLADVRWPEAAEALLAEGRRAGKVTVLDADVAEREVHDRLVGAAANVVFSASALAAYTTESDPETALALLAERGIGRFGCLGVTLGERGFLGLAEGRRLEVRAPPAPAAIVDTLAAGDTFHGVFALSLAQRRGVDDALRRAVTAATLKCTHFGGNLGAPDREAVDAFLAQVSRTHEL